MQETMGVRHSSSLASPLITVIRGHLAWKALRYTADDSKGETITCLSACVLPGWRGLCPYHSPFPLSRFKGSTVYPARTFSRTLFLQ